MSTNFRVIKMRPTFSLLVLLTVATINGLDPSGLLRSIIGSDKSSSLIDGNQKSSSKHVYRSFNQFIYCTPSFPIQYPKTASELQSLIRSAIASKSRVKVFGSRHSITDIICTDGIPISSRFLNHSKVNSDGTATFGSGVQLTDALEALHSAGRSLIHVHTFGETTLGGAIGIGAHGSSLRHPSSISDQLVSVTLIDGKGDIRTISGNDGDDFRAIGVHLGLLGAITEITVTTVPLFKMTVSNTPNSDTILEDGTALSDARVYDLYQIFWFPSSRSVIVSKGNYTDLHVPGNASTNLVPSIDPPTVQLAKSAYEGVQAGRLSQGALVLEEYSRLSLHSPVVGVPPIFEDGGTFSNPATGFAHRLLQNRCRPCVWEYKGIQPDLSSIAVPLSELHRVVHKIKLILRIYPTTFGFYGIFIRFSKASNNFMAVEGDRDTVHVEWITVTRADPFNSGRDRIATYQAIMQAMLKDHQGRPHWGKNGGYFFTQAILRKIPHLSKFTSFMKKYDPDGIFLNKFGRRILLQSDDLTVDPKVTRCALQDYCVCKKNSDCEAFQICNTEAFNGSYSVCQDRLPVLVEKPVISYYSNPSDFSSIADAVKEMIG